MPPPEGKNPEVKPQEEEKAPEVAQMKTAASRRSAVEEPIPLNVRVLPNTFRPIANHLRVANQYVGRDPIIHYWCLYYSIQKANELVADDETTKEYLDTMLAVLKYLKFKYAKIPGVQHDSAAREHISAYVISLMKDCTQCDRQKLYDNNLVGNYFTAGLLCDVLTTFGPIDEAKVRLRNFAKWKANYLIGCLKAGVEPALFEQSDYEGSEEALDPFMRHRMRPDLSMSQLGLSTHGQDFKPQEATAQRIPFSGGAPANGFLRSSGGPTFAEATSQKTPWRGSGGATPGPSTSRAPMQPLPTPHHSRMMPRLLPASPNFKTSEAHLRPRASSGRLEQPPPSPNPMWRPLNSEIQPMTPNPNFGVDGMRTRLPRFAGHAAHSSTDSISSSVHGSSFRASQRSLAPVLRPIPTSYPLYDTPKRMKPERVISSVKRVDAFEKDGVFYEVSREVDPLLKKAAQKVALELVCNAILFAKHRTRAFDKNKSYKRVSDPKSDLKFLQMAQQKQEEKWTESNPNDKEELARKKAIERQKRETNEAALAALGRPTSSLASASSQRSGRQRAAPAIRVGDRDLMFAMCCDEKAKRSQTYTRLLYLPSKKNTDNL
ncbi:hypothetical protein L596_019949 [Steinernema carpocapsae]|uniref:Uncharacterized protein n=1 Tax=Steinernema carpocapsae TaxID=34508 RepID=A0A4V6A0S1_STECR|nr:hypothetical protein L596_019949 [Steinernema carpocapsae]